jgi:hypothetical protein
MNMSKIAQLNALRWNGVMFGFIVVVMVHLTAATNVDDPWPLLLSSEQVNSDPDLTLLHQRAHGSLEKLVQSARAPEQPL